MATSRELVLAAALAVLLAVLQVAVDAKPLEPCPSSCRCFLSEGLKRADCKHVPEWADQQSDAQDVRIVPPAAGRGSRSSALHLTHFEVFPKVLQLAVTNRSLVELIPSGFHGLHSLQELDLSHNLLSRFNHKVFLRMPALRRLVLQGNPIVLERGVPLLTSKSLLSLDLSHCDIIDVPRGALEGMRNLTSLSLRGNPIHLEAGKPFLPPGLKTVAELDLSACELSVLPPGALDGLAGLRRLYLDGNDLHVVEKGVLPRGLHLLDLSANQIRNAPTAVVSAMRNLTRLELSDNPITCTCALIGLQGWLSRRLVVTEKPVVCAEPAKYKGLSWTKVNELELCQAEAAQESSTTSDSSEESSSSSDDTAPEETDESSQSESVEVPPASYEMYTHENNIKQSAFPSVPSPPLTLPHVLELKTLGMRSNNEINFIQGDQPYDHIVHDTSTTATSPHESLEDDGEDAGRASVEDADADHAPESQAAEENDTTEKDAEVFMRNADTIAMGKSMPEGGEEHREADDNKSVTTEEPEREPAEPTTQAAPDGEHHDGDGSEGHEEHQHDTESTPTPAVTASTEHDGDLDRSGHERALDGHEETHGGDVTDAPSGPSSEEHFGDSEEGSEDYSSSTGDEETETEEVTPAVAVSHQDADQEPTASTSAAPTSAAPVEEEIHAEVAKNVVGSAEAGAAESEPLTTMEAEKAPETTSESVTETTPEAAPVPVPENLPGAETHSSDVKPESNTELETLTESEPSAVPEATPEVITETTVKVPVEVIPDPVQAATAGSVPESAPSIAPEPSPEFVPEASPEVEHVPIPETAPEVTSEATHEISPENVPESLPGVVPDAGAPEERHVVGADVNAEVEGVIGDQSPGGKPSEELAVEQVPTSPENQDKEEVQKSTITYIILGCIVVAMVVLIMYALLRSKAKKADKPVRIRRDNENPGTEMKDMMNPLLEPAPEQQEPRRGSLVSLELIREVEEDTADSATQASELVAETANDVDDKAPRPARDATPVAAKGAKAPSSAKGPAGPAGPASPEGKADKAKTVDSTRKQANANGKANGKSAAPPAAVAAASPTPTSASAASAAPQLSKVKVKAGVITTPEPRTPVLVDRVNGTNGINGKLNYSRNS